MINYYHKSAYGVTDRLVDHYWSIGIIISIVVSVIIIVSIPAKWYFALLVAPFIVWASPMVFLLPVYLVEMLVYSIHHFSKVYQTILTHLAFLCCLGLSVFISFQIVRVCAALFATPDASTWEFAYVSESPNAYSFHYSENCNALRKTTYDIELMSVEEAEDYDYEPCRLCLKESKRKQWDDAAGVLFIPVSCLIFWLINKIGRFHKEYKFRNPIIKR